MRDETKKSSIGLPVFIGIVWCADFVTVTAQWFAAAPCTGKAAGAGPMVGVIIIGVGLVMTAFDGWALGKPE